MRMMRVLFLVFAGYGAAKAFWWGVYGLGFEVRMPEENTFTMFLLWLLVGYLNAVHFIYGGER